MLEVAKMTAKKNAQRLWLLRPVDGAAPWEPWFDKAFGFVVRAATEEEARAMAQADGGDELSRRDHDRNGTPIGAPGWSDKMPTWTDPALATCEELTAAGEPGVILRDFAAA